MLSFIEILLGFFSCNINRIQSKIATYLQISIKEFLLFVLALQRKANNSIHNKFDQIVIWDKTIQSSNSLRQQNSVFRMWPAQKGIH